MVTDWDRYQGVLPCAKAWEAADIICERLTLLENQGVEDTGHCLRLRRNQVIPNKMLKNLRIGFAQMIQFHVYGKAVEEEVGRKLDLGDPR